MRGLASGARAGLMRHVSWVDKCASGTLACSNTPGRSSAPSLSLSSAWPPVSSAVTSRSAPCQPGRPMPPGSGEGAAAIAKARTLARTLKVLGASSGPSQRASTGCTVPSGLSWRSKSRRPAPIGRRSARSASAARSSRSALSSPPLTGWLAPTSARRMAWVWRQLTANWLGAQSRPGCVPARVPASALVAKLRPLTVSLTPLAERSATKRPLRRSKASGSRPGAKRTDTLRSTASKVSACGRPCAQSTQARSPAWPCRKSTGRLT